MKTREDGFPLEGLNHIPCRHCYEEWEDESSDLDAPRLAEFYLTLPQDPLKKEPICTMCLDEMFEIYPEDAVGIMISTLVIQPNIN